MAVDTRFPCYEVREAATAMHGLLSYFDAACEGLIDAGASEITSASGSPLRVLMVTQRLQISLADMRQALEELIPSQAVTGMHSGDEL